MVNWTLDQYRKTFFDMEKKLDLFSKTIIGVHFWKLLRADIFFRSKERLVTKELPPTVKVKRSVRERIDKFYDVNSSPLNNKGVVDYYILDRGKKSKYKNQLIDIFGYDIEQEIINKGYKYKIIDYPYFNEYFCEFNDIRKNIESMYYFSAKNNQKLKIRLTHEESRILKLIEHEFYNIFHFNINEICRLENKAINEVKRFKKEYLYYRKLFLETKPKKIFTTLYYRRHSAVLAAQDLGIKVVDIQYGNININHPAFSFPSGMYIPYFPDEIIVWGDFFKDAIPVPNNAKIIAKAPTYFKNAVEEYKHIKKQKKYITFASQYSIGEHLFEIAYKFAIKNSNFKVVFRLHPGELGKFKQYKSFNKSTRLKNFRISSKDTEELHELLAKSEYQVGVYSTTMIEGIEHNIKSIFVNLEGVEEFEFFYKKGYAPLINNEDELIYQINNFDFKDIDLNHFFNFENKISVLEY